MFVIFLKSESAEIYLCECIYGNESKAIKLQMFIKEFEKWGKKSVTEKRMDFVNLNFLEKPTKKEYKSSGNLSCFCWLMCVIEKIE